MTGPEHYAEAERVVAQVENRDVSAAAVAAYTAVAQVHATLALAAATALIDEKPRSGSFDAWREWKQATGGAEYPEVTP